MILIYIMMYFDLMNEECFARWARSVGPILRFAISGEFFHGPWNPYWSRLLGEGRRTHDFRGEAPMRGTYARGGTAFKHSPFRAASPARQPRALARLGAHAARLEPEALFPLSVRCCLAGCSSAPVHGLIAVTEVISEEPCVS